METVMRYCLGIFAALAAVLFAQPAFAEKRVALVIGNSAYQHTPALNNPRNDAADVAASLRRLGFEVLEGNDLDKRGMERLIRQFGLRLAAADLALFFYAGHGIQLGGQNYLLPTDARFASEGDADFETIALSLVLKQMEREAKTSIVLLDACRDNPLARNLARHMGMRSTQVGQGLAEVRTGVGTLIGFSTQPGNVALDGAGRNSPYAEALLRHMELPAKDVTGVLIAVRNDVLKVTDGKQVPWEHTSLTGQVYLKPNVETLSPGAASPPAGATPNYDRELEISFWNSVKDSRSPALLQTYLERYPNGTFAGLARAMINQMQQIASLPPSGKMLPQQEGPDLVRALQIELQRVGCHTEPADGIWGRKVRRSLEQFASRTKTSLQTDEPSQAALDAVKARHDRVCPLNCGAGRIEVSGKCVARPEDRPRRPHAADGAKRAPRGKAEEEKTGMCWGLDGRVGIIVPCTDSRARMKAY
jgi:hypothetical protein